MIRLFFDSLRIALLAIGFAILGLHFLWKPLPIEFIKTIVLIMVFLGLIGFIRFGKKQRA